MPRGKPSSTDPRPTESAHIAAPPDAGATFGAPSRTDRTRPDSAHNPAPLGKRATVAGVAINGYRAITDACGLTVAATVAPPADAGNVRPLCLANRNLLIDLFVSVQSDPANEVLEFPTLFYLWYPDSSNFTGRISGRAICALPETGRRAHQGCARNAVPPCWPSSHVAQHCWNQAGHPACQ